VNVEQRVFDLTMNCGSKQHLRAKLGDKTYQKADRPVGFRILRLNLPSSCLCVLMDETFSIGRKEHVLSNAFERHLGTQRFKVGMHARCWQESLYVAARHQVHKMSQWECKDVGGEKQGAVTPPSRSMQYLHVSNRVELAPFRLHMLPLPSGRTTPPTHA
jgi:hypothetical protein